MDRPETRELAYFVAIAEELHFGRAAQRLGIAQPALSRAVKQLERRLEVVLLERTSRKVVLTSAGEVLLEESRAVLDSVTAAARRTQRAGRPNHQLVVAVPPCSDGGMLRDILAAYASEPDVIGVELEFGDSCKAMVLDGRADAGLLYRPAADPQLVGIDTEELLVEQPVAILPRTHRLAGRSHLRLADLRGERLPSWPDVPNGGRGDLPVVFARGPLVHNAVELMQRIELGHTIALEPISVIGAVRPVLVVIPVLDAPPITLVVAWPAQSRSRAVAAFVRTAKTVAARHQAVPHGRGGGSTVPADWFTSPTGTPTAPGPGA